MPVFAALGAECTVLDYSRKQLEREALVAEREGYDIQIVHADMTRPLPFDDEAFDLIFHPVCNDYIQDVDHVFHECYRVLKKGGTLVCGLGKEINYAIGLDGKTIAYKLPWNPLENAEYRKILEEEHAGMQFSHSLEEQIGGQLRAGFVLKDLYEDTNGEGYLHEMNYKTFLATLAVKEER